MRILQVHNFYQQVGGEDRVLAAERALLMSNGHTVSQFTAHNDDVTHISPLQLAVKTVWNSASYHALRKTIQERLIGMIHVHNTFPLISPSVYYAAYAERIPVVQTLHNYRLLCPAATFSREGQLCELCLHKKIKYPAVVHRCYRASRPASAAVATMLAGHRFAHTWRSKVHTYIALTEFAKRKFIEGGIPASHLQVKPNFLAEDPGPGPGTGGYALFAGRLTEEKGVETMLNAWRYRTDVIPLKIAGDGPLRAMVEQRASAAPNIEYLGPCETPHVFELLQNATFLIFPSEWYEGMPMILIEAMACGTPCLTFGLGAMNELIADGVNGFRLPFKRDAVLGDFLGDSGQMTRKFAHLRASTRAYFERHFAPSRNYQILMDIYRYALNHPR